MRPESLSGADHIRTGRVGNSTDFEVDICLFDSDSALDQDVDELGRRQEIGLVRRNDVSPGIPHFRPAQLIESLVGIIPKIPYLFDTVRRDRPAVPVATLDGIHPHPPDVEQQRVTKSRSDIKNGSIRRDGILHRLCEMPRLGLDRQGIIPAWNLQVEIEPNLNRRRAADRLGQETDHVMEIGTRAETSVPPR